MYSSLSASDEISTNVLNAGGTGSDNASIYLIGHGLNKVYCAFPKGSVAGLQHEDNGRFDFNDDNGQLKVYQHTLQWKSTLVVQDWRFCVRICNIDVSDLAGGSAADLPELMIEAMDLLPNLDNACFYMNRKVRTALRQQTRNDVISGGGLTFDTVAGKKVAHFDEVPVKRVDALLNTEAAVS